MKIGDFIVSIRKRGFKSGWDMGRVAFFYDDRGVERRGKIVSRDYGVFVNIDEVNNWGYLLKTHTVIELEKFMKEIVNNHYIEKKCTFEYEVLFVVGS